jgi:two-component system, NtrC family, response regulator AtoC
MPDPAVLIVDDEKHTRDGLRLSLNDGFEVYTAADIAGAMRLLKEETIQVLLTDLRLGAEDGMDLMEQALRLPRPPICIVMTAYGSVDVAVEAMRRGAYHFVTKPLHIDEVEMLIRRALRGKTLEEENQSLRAQVEERFAVDSLVGRSPMMQDIYRVVEQVAPTSATVLIEGESGTGKELVARAIHNLSSRPKEKLVTVHCAALSENLLESELFGHERGAFTGAAQRRIGRFELADGGTLVLDEVGEIDLPTQVKLLRAIGEQSFERVGGNQPLKVDVRVVCATNRDLESMVAQGTFREDLFYRINVVRIHMPPLRDRKEDVVLLADVFLKELATRNGRPFKELTTDALQCLVDYDWPGNVRELRTAVEHGVVMSNTPKITLRHLPESVRSGGGRPRPLPAQARHASHHADSAPAGQAFNLARIEHDTIQRALAATAQNRTEAATLLGISRRTLQRKLKEYAEIPS